MAIEITDSEIILTSETYSFEDIFQYAVNYPGSVESIGNSYKINRSIRLKDNSYLKDINKYIEVTGPYFIIEKGSTLQLGEITDTGQTINGCYLNMPNISFKYGFGNTDTTNSGNLLLYNSRVIAYCFWSFFAGDNHVELIDCYIDGFGRLSGENSIVKRVEHARGNGRYGTFSLAGEIKEYTDIVVKNVEEYNGFKCCLYHNPYLSGNLLIKNSILNGYDKLAYIEDTSGADTLEILDSVINGTYEVYRETNNVDLLITYTLKLKVLETDMTPISGANVKCYDSSGDLIFEENTDEMGELITKVKFYTDTKDGEIIIHNPFNFIIEKEDDKMGFLMEINKPTETTIYFQSGEVIEPTDSTNDTTNCDIDYDMIKELIETTVNKPKFTISL